MSKHTPGPWKFHEPYSGFSKISGPNGELIFGIAAGSEDEKRSDDECEANARLIAAAPDLLAALKAAERTIADSHGATVASESATRHHLAPKLEAIRAAIKSATTPPTGRDNGGE